MPLNLADFANTEIETVVETSAGPLGIRYRPNALTPRLEAEIAASSGEAATETLLKTFCAVVSWMDLEGPLVDAAGAEVIGAGEPVPVEPEYVGLLPSRLLTQVFTAVQEDMSGGPKRGSGSSGGSFTSGSKPGARRSGTG
jgi:hypothetical protein